MTNSTHKVEVVPIVLERHPDADTLSIVRIFDDYTCVVRTQDWAGVTQAAYIPPDNVVPDRPEYAFLGPKAKHRRVKAKKLRGIWSMGLLVRAPDGSQLGDDVAELLGVTHYKPKMFASRPGFNLGKSVDVPPPPGCAALPKYDLEAFRKYGRTFVPNELVLVTEKLHGCNARYVYTVDDEGNGTLHAGSRARWTKEDPEKPNVWWRALRATPSLVACLMANPGTVIYGEVYGQVQDLTYGHADGAVSFAAFDVMDDGRWMDAVFARVWLDQWNVPQVPLVYDGPFDFEQVKAFADGPTLIPGASHVREGVVVVPAVERWNERVGRVKLKLVSNLYLERSDRPELMAAFGQAGD